MIDPTAHQIISLVLDGFTAIGTVGAVIISLWLTVRKTPRFCIRDIQMARDITLDDGKNTSEENFLIIKLENMLDTQMQVFEIAIQAKDISKNKTGMTGCGVVIPLKQTFIPQRSIYNVRMPIQSDYEPGTFKKAQKIRCVISTSFGDQETKFPADWKDRLCEALEKPAPA